MRKRSVTARIEEGRLKLVGRFGDEVHGSADGLARAAGLATLHVA